MIGATWQESMDLSCATGQITLGRGHGDFNLSPLMTGPAVNSPAPALDGVIDNINAAGPDDTIVLEVRDRGGRLLNHVIKGSADPATPAASLLASSQIAIVGGLPVEQVMQDILNREMPGVTLVVPSSPGWNIFQFTLRQEPLLEAVDRGSTLGPSAARNMWPYNDRNSYLATNILTQAGSLIRTR